MKRELMEVEKERFSLKEKDKYLLQGTWNQEYRPEVFLDRQRVSEVEFTEADGKAEIYIKMPVNIN